MKPEDVPDEWVAAMFEELNTWPTDREMRAALAAVAPLIAAQERERLKSEEQDAKQRGVARLIEGRHDNEVHAMIGQIYPSVRFTQLGGPDFTIWDVQQALRDRATARAALAPTSPPASEPQSP